MQLVDRLRARPWLAAASAGALVGIVVGLFLPIRAASPPKADDAVWVLPTRAATERFNEGHYQAVRSATFWGDIAAPGGPRAAAWNLSGIVTRPVVMIAVTTPGKDATTWVRLGRPMPDGSIFVAANRDTVWYEKDGCRRARKLYQKPTTASEACIGAPAGAANAPSSGTAAAAPSVAPAPDAPAPAAPAAPAARGPH